MVEILVNFESVVWFQLKESGLWNSSSVLRSSSLTGASCTTVSPSKPTHSTSQSPRVSRVHSRHIHQAGYQQLMDIINLPRRIAITQPSPSAVLKTANCGADTPSARIASSSTLGKSTPRSLQSVDDGPAQDEALKPTDVLVQFVDTL